MASKSRFAHLSAGVSEIERFVHGVKLAIRLELVLVNILEVQWDYYNVSITKMWLPLKIFVDLLISFSIHGGEFDVHTFTICIQ